MSENNAVSQGKSKEKAQAGAWGADLKVSVKRTLSISAQRAYESWLEPETLKKFMTPGEGMSVPKATVDAREGGEFLIVMKAGDQEMPHHGVYKTLNPYKELAFTWLSPFQQPPAAQDSLVTVTFREISKNETEVHLTHVGFANEESRSNHQGGWDEIVRSLGEITLG